MLQFQPPGFRQEALTTSLGVVAYYIPAEPLWHNLSHQRDDAKGDRNGTTSEDSRSEESTKGDDTRPLMLFLHSLGGGSSAYEWSKVYPAFASDYQVVAPDLIGWGQSAHPARDYTADDYISVICEILDHWAEPAAIVASSLTGALALRVAIAHPDKVRSLFLVCPSGYADFGADYRRGIAAQLAGTPLVDRLVYTLGAANELAVRNFLQQFLFANPARITDEMVQAYLASALQPNAEYSALASLRGALFFDLSLYIRQLKTPTAFLWGTEARFNSPELGHRLAALNPDAITAFYEISEVGVLPQLEQPAVTAGLLRSWVGN